MTSPQRDLFEQQVDAMTDGVIELSAELVESEHRSSYLRYCINGVHLINAATGLLEQAQTNFQEAKKVSHLHQMHDEIGHVESTIVRLKSALEETKKVL